MSLKRFAIEEWVGSLVLSSIPLLVSNSVLLAAFSKIVLYEYCQTLLTFTCLIPPHSLDGKFSLSRPRLVAWSRSCGLAAGCWMLDAPFDSSPEFITPESEQPWLVLPLVLLPHYSIQLIHLTSPSLLLLVHYWVLTPNYQIRSQHNKPGWGQECLI